MDFTPKERRIFRFSNGSKMVAADPRACHRRLWEALQGKDLQTLVNQMRLGDPDLGESHNPALAELATQQVLAVSYAAFRLQPIDDDGNGTTEDECLDVFFQFLGFLEKNAPGGATMPTCSTPSASASPTPTESGSDSGSTSIASPSAVPTK